MSEGSPWSKPGGQWSSGVVTAPAAPAAPQSQPPGIPPQQPPGRSRPSPGRPEQPPAPSGGTRRQLLIFGGVAGGIVAIGLVAILIVLFGSGGDAFREQAAAPEDNRPPLAQMCPAPSTLPDEQDQAPAPAPAAGEQTVDEEAGISYQHFGAPWLPWTTVWRAGTLEVPYRVGQHFVTEEYSGGSYHASILSAAVPAADNDAVSLNLDCVGRQVAADVRAEYYPQPNTMETLRDGLTTLGGRPAYLNEFRLKFNSPGLTATEERSAVAVVDVGKTTAAVLYISIPGTHKQFDYVIQQTLDSVRPL